MFARPNGRFRRAHVNRRVRNAANSRRDRAPQSFPGRGRHIPKGRWSARGPVRPDYPAPAAIVVRAESYCPLAAASVEKNLPAPDSHGQSGPPGTRRLWPVGCSVVRFLRIAPQLGELAGPFARRRSDLCGIADFPGSQRLVRSHRKPTSPSTVKRLKPASPSADLAAFVTDDHHLPRRPCIPIIIQDR